MSYALVQLLNRAGYQPIFAKAGLLPPDLYTYERTKRGFVMRRRGGLAKYLEDVRFRSTMLHVGEEFTSRSSSGKGANAAVGFLNQVLQCVGLTSPKLDLSFTGSSELRFSLVGVTSREVEVADIEPHLAELKLDAIPPSLLEDGRVFIGYDYLYASGVAIERADAQSFAVSAQSKLCSYLDLGADGEACFESAARAIVRPKNGRSVACALKAGRVTTDGERRYLSLEDPLAGAGGEGNRSRPVIPRRNIVLGFVDDGEERVSG